MDQTQRRDRRLVLVLSFVFFCICSGFMTLVGGGIYLAYRMASRPVQIEASDTPQVVLQGTCEMLSVGQLPRASQFDAYGFPRSIPDPFELRAMLDNREFARLNAALEVLQQEAERDFRREDWLNTAFSELGREQKGYEHLFDAWVQAHPDSAVALIARARYRADLGWLARGHAWASKTSQAQFDEMGRQFRLAHEDIQLALQRNSRILYGYSTLIELANAGGGEFGRVREHYDAGLEASPRSIWLRRTYMGTLRPRWGGSYRAMKRFADECQSIQAVEPRVRSLYGWIPWDRATLSADQHERIQLCTTALSYCEDSRFLKTRADAYLRLKRYRDAFEDYDRAVQLWPLDVRARARRAELHAYLGRVDRGLADLAIAERLDPTEPRVIRARIYVGQFPREGSRHGEK